ncbi:MAG: lipid-A-disaccharide synthase [Thiolinea sp.]
MQRIAIIAGEPSGDLLAARLIRALQALQPDWQFEGVAGPEMQAAGCQALFPMDKLSVMGLVEVLGHLPELLSIRKHLYQRWQQHPPDLFIGVDAPDFNLPLARRLHALGIPTVHYVSPSIWAWREHRVKKIRGSIDLMLTLFPFEVGFYQRHQIPARFVGHPLADEISFAADRHEARATLGLDQDQPLLAVLPGSRQGEIKRLGTDFLQAAAALQQHHPDLQVAIPAINPAVRQHLESLLQEQAPQLQVHLLDGQSRLLMQAADYILLASGTAVLEGMLSGRLMVAAYRVSALTWWLLKTFRLLKVRYVTLPNNLANEALVPEILQDQLTPERLVDELEQLMQMPPARRDYILQRFQVLHEQLRCDASRTAAQAIIEHFYEHEPD